MRRLLGSLALLVSLIAGAHADGGVPAQERAAYEQALLLYAHGRDLHLEPVAFTDGAKGRWMSMPMARKAAPAFPPGMTREDDYAWWQTGCHAALVATATHLDATPFLTPGNAGILTRDRFRVEQVIKAPQGIAPGSPVSVARPGGEVLDGGETLRVVVDFVGAPFIPGQRYLLVAGQEAGFAPDMFYVQDRPHARVIGSVIHLEGHRAPDDVMAPAFELARFAQKLGDIAARFPCRTR